MTTASDRLLTARMSLALVVANARGNHALVARAVVVEVATSAGDVGNDVACGAPAHRDRFCVGVFAAPAHVAERGVQLTGEGIVRPHAFGECSKHDFERFEVVPRQRVRA